MSDSDSPAALQRAIYAALKDVVGVPVYDGAPQDAALPYVDLGEAQVLPWDTKTELGSEHAITLHAWSAAASKGETWAMLAAIKTALHRQELSLAGQALVMMRLTDEQVFRDVDGVTWHGVARYRALTQPEG